MSGLTIPSLLPLSEHPSDMDHNVTIRPPKRPAPGNYSDRAQARMIRQKLIEHEQELEDREALKITPEELRILRDSFSSVKAEFTDLDGLSWDTPIARQVLLNWHAQQAVRASLHHDLGLGDFVHRMRGASHSPSPRRSLASIMRPPGLSAGTPYSSESPISTTNPEHGGHVSGDDTGGTFDLTIRVRAHAGPTSTPATSPASLLLGVPTNGRNEQTPLPALFEPVSREYADIGLTPQPHHLTFDVHSVADVEPTTPIPSRSAHLRPTVPLKSHSTPCVPLASDAFLPARSPPTLPSYSAGDARTKSERPIKRLPPSRIPLPRSKSLGASSGAQLASIARCFSANAALPASVSAPAIPFRMQRPPPARKPVPSCEETRAGPLRAPLADSSTLNRGSEVSLSSDIGPEPSSPTSPSTKLYPLSSAHRGRVGYNYRPAPQRGGCHDS